MTDYIALYQQKKLTADEVAARVENGWLIGMDAAIGQTPAIIDAICRRAENSPLSGVRVQMLLDVYPYAFYADDPGLPAAAPGKRSRPVLRTMFRTTIVTARGTSAPTTSMTLSVSPSPRWTSTVTSASEP